MRSAFSGLELARRALQTQQTSLNTVGHNIANANTPGYSRQEVITSATGPYTSPSNVRPMKAGQIGTGVGIVAIKRQFDKYVANQWRHENALLAQWSQKQSAMEQIEAIFNEPSDSSLRKSVDDFWSALNQLAIEPTELSSRALVRQTAITMIDSMKTMDRQLEQVDTDYNELARAGVNEINSLLTQIEAVSIRIVRSTAMGDQPNDLLDQRDLLLDKLTELINVNIEENPQKPGDIQISFGENGDQKILVPFVGSGTQGERFDYTAQGGKITIGGEDVTNSVTQGKMKGILESKEAVAKYRNYLSEYAYNYLDAINEQHTEGFDLNGDAGIPIFVLQDGTWPDSDHFDIKDLQVNPDIINNLTKIAASDKAPVSDDAEHKGDNYTHKGDGANAVKLAAIRHSGEMQYSGATVTYDQFYRAVVADLGIETDQTIKMTDNQQVLAYQFELRQEQFRGVSLDEEMTKMVQYQHSYAAAARLTTTIDEMIDIIVNRLGTVGR